MNKEELFESMDGIDEEILERSEKASAAERKVWKVVLPIAACFCLIVAAVITAPRMFSDVSPIDNTTQSGESLLPANGNWTIDYMPEDPDKIHTQVAAIPGYFEGGMTTEEMEAILPTDRPEWLRGVGYSGFDGDGQLRVIRLKLHTPVDDEFVNVRISKQAFYDCVIHDSRLSVCNGVKYNVYQYNTDEDRVMLAAKAQINDYWFSFSFTVWLDDLEQGKAVFKDILECFTYYAEPDKPDWSAVTSDHIPEVYNEEITLEQARSDESFGAFIPVSVPEGFEIVSCNRYKDFRNDDLSILWRSETEELKWEVRWYDPDVHASKMTNVADVSRCYQEFYPIFEAEDLTETVVNKRLESFTLKGIGIKCGNIVIMMRGIAEEGWLWEQLVSMGVVADEEERVYINTWENFVYMDEVYADETFGDYIPKNIDQSEVFLFYRYKSDSKDFLEIQLETEESTQLYMHITAFDDASRLTSVEEVENYDLSAYSHPWDPDIPEQKKQILEEPIFDASELTLDAVRARIYHSDSAHSEPRMEFGVRYGDVVIYVFASGIPAETVYDLLMRVNP